MKKFFAIQLMMLFVAVAAMADNKLVIKDFTLVPGQIKTVEVVLDNEDQLATFEFYMDVPEGLEIVSLPAATDRVPTNRGTWVSQWKNTSETQIYVTYLSNDPTKPATHIQGHEGAVATFQVTAKEKLVGKSLSVHDIELVDPDDNPIHPEDFKVNIVEVEPVITGQAEATTLSPGQVSSVTLALFNEVTCGSLQFDVELTPGLSLVEEDGEVKYDFVDPRTGEDVNLRVSKIGKNGENKYRFVLSKLLTGVGIVGYDGDFLKLYVKMDEDVTAETCNLTIGNVTMSDNEAKPNTYYGPAYNMEFVVGEKPRPSGDFSGDGEINITDLSILIENIVTQANDPAYDLNGDNVVNITDLSILIELIVNSNK